jgi:hypothetical protein
LLFVRDFYSFIITNNHGSIAVLPAPGVGVEYEKHSNGWHITTLNVPSDLILKYGLQLLDNNGRCTLGKEVKVNFIPPLFRQQHGYDHLAELCR